MGALLPSYKSTVINSILTGINTNTSCIFAFAANPVSFTGDTPAITLDDYSALFKNEWQLLFGKRLQVADIVPVINNIQWTTNTVYSQYDNTDQNLSQKNFYVLVPPQLVGGPYNVYKCIANANGAPSTQIPTIVQPSSFTTADGYTWRYITTITAAEYDKFYTLSYAPCYTNTTISASAFSYSGVENCVITNGGNGYSAYSISNTNLVVSTLSPTQIQVQNYESTINNFYVGSAIYLYNTQSATSQLFNIADYTSNSIGNFVTLATAANTQNIIPSITKYYISPAVTFTSDALISPAAFSTVNTTSNSILSIVIINPGSELSWCNVAITTNSAAVSSNSSVYAIVPPLGGHGANAPAELFLQGMGLSFNFANSEGGTIPTNITYNQIGLCTNMMTLNANNTEGPSYVTNTFSAVLQGNLTPTTTFAVGNVVTGTSSGAVGTVAFCNGTNIYLTGDKSFISGETVLNSNGTSSVLTINTIGQVYTKSLVPWYIQNISNVARSANTTESYKIIIGI